VFVTEQRLAADAISHLAAIVESSYDAIVGRTLDGVITSWNTGAERLFGYSADEMIGRSVALLVPEGGDVEIAGISELVRAGERAEFEAERLRKDGTLVEVSSTVSPVRDATRTIIGASAISRDIGERKRLEEQLRRSEESYRHLFDRHPGSMWLFEPETLRFLAVNDAAIATYGYTREEFLAMTIADIRPTEDRSALEKALRDGAREYVHAGVWRHLKKDGTQIEASVFSNLVEFEGQQARLVLAQDVTEQRRLEEQLLQGQKMEAIGSLAGGIAHDFNNILLVIRGHSAGLLRELGNDRLRDSVQQIDRAAERAAEFTHQLLAFSRQQVLRLEVTDLNPLVVETLRLLRRMLGDDIQVDIQLDPEVGSILIDRGQLGQAILNLVVNASDAMPGGGTLTVRTANVELDEAYASTHDEVAPGSYVLLQVTDSGTGMDAETQRRIFDPFFTTKEQGTGLGLATVYGLVKQSRGHIWLYSEPLMGSTFKLYFPVTDDEATPSLEAGVVESLEGDEMILLVEDTEMVRSLVTSTLEFYGYSVLAAADGVEAQELAARHQIDLLMTDVVMPHMNGRELAESLLAHYPHVKVLFTSGYPADTIIRHGISTARTAFIEKPYVPDELARKIREVLDTSAL
jgi:PAS domain S-box-containing protein